MALWPGRRTTGRGGERGSMGGGGGAWRGLGSRERCGRTVPWTRVLTSRGFAWEESSTTGGFHEQKMVAEELAVGSTVRRGKAAERWQNGGETSRGGSWREESVRDSTTVKNL